MREFEILIEDINPCGGSQFAKREILEAEAESPEDYVLKNGRFPILSSEVNADGDTVISPATATGMLSNTRSLNNPGSTCLPLRPGPQSARTVGKLTEEENCYV